MSLLIKNAITRQGKPVNISVENGLIVGIQKPKQKVSENNFDEVIDTNQSLVTESLISPHIHLDKVLIGDIIEPNKSGTLWEAIQKTWEVKEKYFFP